MKHVHFRSKIFAGLIGFVGFVGPVAAVEMTDIGTSGGIACKVASFVTKQLADDPAPPPTTAEIEALRKQITAAWANAMAETGATPEEFDANVATEQLAALMADIDAKAKAETGTETPKTEWTPFDIARTAFAIAGLADPTGASSVVAAYFYPKCSTNEAQNGNGTFCWKDSQPRGVGLIPKGCDAAHPNYENGLCYSNCPSGMKGEGPACWTASKVSQPRGVGVVPASCPGDRPDKQAGLCYQACPEGYGGVGPVCWKGIKSQGRGAGVVPNACDPSKPDFNAGLCYAACPSGMTGVGPVCWTESKVSQPRGVGVIPTGCPADRPVLDAGLCYPACANGEGIGPVCWMTCAATTRFVEGCGAGCATNKLECGFATTDMVASPLEMTASLVSIGTASGATAGARASRKAAREAAEASAKAAKKAAQTAEDAAKRIDDMVEVFGNDQASVAMIKAIVKNAPDGAAEAAWKQAKGQMKNGFGALKARAAKTAAIIEKDGPTRLIALFKKSPKQRIADAAEKSARGKQFLARLEKAYDTMKLRQVMAAESFIAGCAKLGLAVSKAAMGAPGGPAGQ